jgi:glycosyltransferase involved in cell wall biosynthesis
LVFVDDHSTDGSPKILQGFKENFKMEYDSILLVQTPKNKKGRGVARNTCLKYFKGDFIFWVDSDTLVPRQVLLLLLSHFYRDTKIGWVNVPTTVKNPTFYLKIYEARIPKSFRYVNEAEVNCSLIRKEVMEFIGYFDEVEWYELPPSQRVKVRKAGWKTVIDGSLSDRTIHLSRSGVWGIIYDKRSKRPYLEALRRLLHFIRHYTITVPKRPIHEWIKAGDLKCALKIVYYFAIPYLLLYGLISSQYFLFLSIVPALAYYAIEVRGWQIKVIAPFMLVLRWMFVAQGYAFFLLKIFARRVLGKL